MALSGWIPGRESTSSERRACASFLGSHRLCTNHVVQRWLRDTTGCHWGGVSNCLAGDHGPLRDLLARHARTPWHAVVLPVFVVVVYPVPTLRPIDLHLMDNPGVELGQIACLPIMEALMVVVGVWRVSLER